MKDLALEFEDLVKTQETWAESAQLPEAACHSVHVVMIRVWIACLALHRIPCPGQGLAENRFQANIC